MKRNLNPPMKRALRLKNLFLTVCFLLIGTAAFSQERTITGVVTDSFKEPLIGVSIVVQGTNTGVVTGLDLSPTLKVMKLPTNLLPTHCLPCKVKWPVYKSSTPVRQVPTRKSAYAVQTLSMVTSPCM